MRAGKVAALDLMAGQAIALAAIEGELLALGSAGLRAGRACANGRADQQCQRQCRDQGGAGRGRVGQRRFPRVCRSILRPNIGGRKHKRHWRNVYAQSGGSRVWGKADRLAPAIDPGGCRWRSLSWNSARMAGRSSPTAVSMRRRFIATIRPIWAVLQPFLAGKSGDVVEAGSGTGQHVVDFARHTPDIVWWPSDLNEQHLKSIAAWRAHAGLCQYPPAAADRSCRSGMVPGAA